LVGGPEIERERVEHQTGCVIDSVPQEDLARHHDRHRPNDWRCRGAGDWG
jgi:hypothetical protein